MAEDRAPTTRVEVSATYMAETRKRYGDRLHYAMSGDMLLSERAARQNPRIEALLEEYPPDHIWEKVAIFDYHQRAGVGLRDRVGWLQDALRHDHAVPPCLAVDLHPDTERVARAWAFRNDSWNCPPFPESAWPYVSYLVTEIGTQAMLDLIAGYLDRRGTAAEFLHSPRWLYENRVAVFLGWEKEREWRERCERNKASTGEKGGT